MLEKVIGLSHFRQPEIRMCTAAARPRLTGVIRRLGLPSAAALAWAALAPGWAGAQTLQSVLSSDPVPEGISAEVWTHALAAHKEATTEGKTTTLTLAIIDFSRPATRRRLWVVDVITHVVLDSEFVAHGQGSGDILPTRFSNQDGTNQSSLGTFITGATYEGVRGHSLRLHGLEAGINDRAFTRGIVFHGTPNVSEARAKAGTMGRTEGCPAVPATAVARVIGRIAHGSVLFAWYPDKDFLERSGYLHRETATARLNTAE